MAEDEVKVKFGADTANLKAGMDALVTAVKTNKAAFDSATLSVKDFTSILSTSVSSIEKVVKQLESQAASAAKVAVVTKDASQAINTVPQALNTVSTASDKAAQAHEHLSLSTAGAKRELIVLAHEMSQGNYSRFGGSLMVLAERMGGLSGPTMAAAAAIGGLGYIAYQVIKNIVGLNTSLSEVQNTMSLMGRSGAWDWTEGKYQIAAIKTEVSDLSRTFGIGKEEAAQVVNEVAALGDASDQTREKLARLGVIYAKLANKDAAEGAKDLTTAFRSFAGIDKMASDMDLFNLAERKAFDEAQRGNDVLKAQEIALKALNERLAPAAGYVQQLNQSEGLMSNVAKPKGPAPTGDAKDQTDIKQYQNDQKRLVSDTRQNLEDIKAQWTRSRVEFADLSQQTWAAVVASHRLAGDQQLAAQRELDHAMIETRKAGYAAEVADSKAHLAEMQASGTMSQKQVLEAQIAENRKLLKDFDGNADERKALETETNVLIRELNAETVAQELRGLQEVARATRSGSQERIDAEQRVHDFTVKKYGEGSAKAHEANDELIAAQKAHQNELMAIEDHHSATAREINALEVQEKKAALQEQVDEGKITTQEMIAQLRQITDATYENDLAQLKADQQRLSDSEQKYQDYADKIKALDEKHKVEHADLGRQMAAADRASAQASANAWSQAVAPISRAWDGMMQGIFSGTQTVGQAFKRMAVNMALSFAESIVGMMAKWLVFQAAQAIGWNGIALSVQKSMQSGTFAWIMGENTKTSATMAGTAARNSAQATEQSSFFVRVGEQIAEWLGLEGGKTAATVAESAARTTADGEATLASVIASKAEAAGVIPVLAGEAGAGAYAATAAIPIVGPALAPAAASLAVMDTLSFLSVASAAGGMESVPADGTIIRAHYEESVLPANIANPMRSFFKSGVPNLINNLQPTANTNQPSGTSAGSSGNTTIVNNISAVDGASVANLLTRSGSPLMRTIQKQLGQGSKLVQGGKVR